MNKKYQHLHSIISSAQKGDAKAFDTIVLKFQNIAIKYAFSRLRDFQLAQDVAQESFMVALHELSNLRSPEAFVSWFRRIVFSRCDRITRRKGLNTLSLEEEIIPSQTLNPLDQLELKERDTLLLKAIRSLSNEERRIIILYHFDRLSHSEISHSLKIPTHTVSNRLRKARKHTKKKLVLLYKTTPTPR